MSDEAVAGRYRLESCLGSGRTTQVYRAYDTLLSRVVVVKLLRRDAAGDPELAERFDREARAIAGLSHANVITVLDRGTDDGRRYIVFEHADRGDLRQLIVDGSPLPVEQALGLAVEIGAGLAHAHAHGIVHRDVKPHNVLLTETGAKLADFGIAATPDSALTQHGTVLGSADYLAPEQAAGRPADERSDVYALGVVLFELLTGRVPFGGESFFETARRHLEEPAPDVRELRPEVPARVADTVRRALEKEPQRRFRSMTELVDELRTHLVPPSDATTIVRRPSGAPRRRVWSRRRLALAGAGLLVAAGAGLLLLLGLPSKHLPAPTALGPSNALATGAGFEAVAAYDPPPGDGVEDNRRLGLATDGNAATFWATEWYASADFGHLKRGVGIVFAADHPVELRALTVESDTPGYSALVEAGTSPHGPFTPVSSRQTCAKLAHFTLTVPAPRRYYLLWITRLSPTTGPRFDVHVNEVTAAS